MSTGSDYQLWWKNVDLDYNSTSDIKNFDDGKDPRNILYSNPATEGLIHVQLNKYLTPVKPQPSLGGRKTRRNIGYVSLSNYNQIP